MRVFYYPGCSSQHLARDLHLSAKAIFEALEVSVEELPDWNCCGANEVCGEGDLVGLVLAARNMALVGRDSTVVTTCSLCRYNLRLAQEAMKRSQEVLESVNSALAEAHLKCDPGGVRILHLLEFLGEGRVLASLIKQLKREVPLTVGVYYGCFLARPFPVEFSSAKKLLQMCGCRLKELELASHCCGGHLPRADSPVIKELSGRILAEAENKGVELVVVMCPVCKLNLELYAYEEGRPQVVFFTQLLAYAVGAPKSMLGSVAGWT